MSGDIRLNDVTFSQLFNDQLKNQNMLLKKGMYGDNKNGLTYEVPVDDTKLMSYHVQQLVSEIGEVLSSDKRWKNFRNAKYDRENKLEEIADLFIVTMNIAMFSGFDAKDVVLAIKSKLDVIKQRIENI